jgi:hypothetical protein
MHVHALTYAEALERLDSRRGKMHMGAVDSPGAGERRGMGREPPGYRVSMRGIDSSVSATLLRAARYAGCHCPTRSRVPSVARSAKEARYPDKTSRLVAIDSPIPGIPPWNQIVRLPALWHFNFGPDAERLVARRERIYLDRFWNEFAGEPSKIDEATRRHYTAIYARPGAMHSAFAQFLAIGQKDEADNLTAMETKLTMPVLAIGAEKAFGANVAVVMRNAAANVQEVVVPNAGHWLMEEAPAATIAAVQGFLTAHRVRRPLLLSGHRRPFVGCPSGRAASLAARESAHAL